MAKMLTVGEILAAQLPERVVEVPEWGGCVRVRAFSKGRQQRLRDMAMQESGAVDPRKIEMLMLVEGVIEPELTEEMIDSLRETSAAAIDRVITAIVEVSGMGPEALKEAEATFR